jgi:hypothetical protein
MLSSAAVHLSLRAERRSPAVAAARDARRRRGARVLPPGRARVRFVPARRPRDDARKGVRPPLGAAWLIRARLYRASAFFLPHRLRFLSARSCDVRSVSLAVSGQVADFS